jgi:HlyD family secretion protein
MADDQNKIEIRSGEVQEILGGVPSWIVRFGTIVFVGIILLVIVFSFIFRYPDILRSNIVVTTENPPATIVARTTAKIDQLFVDDNEKVKKGQLIALLENPANFDDVKELKNVINTVQPYFDTLNFSPPVNFNKNLELGSVQQYYSDFLTKYDELYIFLIQNNYELRIKSMQEQLNYSEMLYDRLWEQKNAVEREYEIRNRNYERQRKLVAASVVSTTDLEKAETEMLSKESELNKLRAELTQKKIDAEKLKQEIINTEDEYNDLKARHQAELMEYFNNLKSEISNWELTYTMRSPTEGVITFNKFWSENKNISEGENAFTVVPENMGDLIGKLELPVRGSGKVVPGLDVNVKFDNYPYMEYGLVRAKVNNVSQVPENNFYMVEVRFPNGLVTNYGTDLSATDNEKLQAKLIGNAEIITQDLKLIQRIFNPLKALWKERVNS